MKKIIIVALLFVVIFTANNTFAITKVDDFVTEIYISDIANLLESTNNNQIEFRHKLSILIEQRNNSEHVNTASNQYSIFGKPLTSEELYLISTTDIQIISLWYHSSQIALIETENRFEDYGDGTIANAFQHAYWNILMVKYMNIYHAENFATAHENYDDNPISHKTMDLINNLVARNFASTLNNINQISDSNLSSLTYEELILEGLTVYLLEYSYLRYIHIFPNRTQYIYQTDELLTYTNKIIPISIPNYEVIDFRGRDKPIPLPLRVGDIV